MKLLGLWELTGKDMSRMVMLDRRLSNHASLAPEQNFSPRANIYRAHFVEYIW